MQTNDTIVAIATPAGSGGVGIVRLSGPQALRIAEAVCARTLPPRRAQYTRFVDVDGTTIDDGIALCFATPASYTGEDVAELQAHGSPAVLQQLVARCCALSARIARAGEFSERAYLNGRLDLAQAEAVADLIAAGDAHAARAARRALDGVFSQQVDALAAALLAIRVHVEAAIDFADEPIDTLGGVGLRRQLDDANAQLDALLQQAERGRRLRDGLHAVIIGPPNAGKSSLLNALAGSDRAIVTDIAGTTRDLLHETIRIDGVELTLVDTAGMRVGGDAIEREGMRRARTELQRADLAVVVLDARDPQAGWNALGDAVIDVPAQLVIHNKSDLLPADSTDGDGDGDAKPDDTCLGMQAFNAPMYVSARTGDGLEILHERLREAASAGTRGEGAFTARARHIEALQRARHSATDAREALTRDALDLAAEALRIAHDALGEITGRTLPDDLLGHIFSTFCIGK